MKHIPRGTWFRFFPEDFLGSEAVINMTAAERGLYICALSLDWRNENGIPNQPEMLARLTRLPLKEVKKAWPAVRKCFASHGDGRLTNDRLKVEREYVEKRREEGRKGAEQRWGGEHTDPLPDDKLPNGEPMGTHPLPNGKTETETETERDKSITVTVPSIESSRTSKEHLFDEIRKAFPATRRDWIEELFAQHGLEIIAKQLQFFPKRKDGARKPWALFRESIKGDWDAPIVPKRAHGIQR